VVWDLANYAPERNPQVLGGAKFRNWRQKKELKSNIIGASSITDINIFSIT
jgi:hypothetical protein